MGLGNKCIPKAANTGDSNFLVQSCIMASVLPVLLASKQEIWICYLVLLLVIATVLFSSVIINQTSNLAPPFLVGKSSEHVP